mmetsp:Transcript_84556/g.196619  ORF Transcript_84556/g.196619 Transcript_84556/m.196619 type:complete len:202 (+) Transcript_84556:50-655(+)
MDGPRGDALRSRLAAQADAALASGVEHPLHQLLLAPQPRTAEQRREQAQALEKFLLERPPGAEPVPQEPLDADALHHAAQAGDLKALAKMDKRLQALLHADDQLQLLQEGDLADPKAKEALRLYRDSFMGLEALQRGATCGVEKEAFQAVMRDDAVALEGLLNGGVSPELKNAGGHTLLQLAKERGKANCEKLLAGRASTS